jgi:hypothetical protein
MEQHSIKTAKPRGDSYGRSVVEAERMCERQGIKLKHQTRQSDANARPQKNFTKEKIVFNLWSLRGNMAKVFLRV